MTLSPDIFSPKVLAVIPFQRGDARHQDNPGEAQPFVHKLGLTHTLQGDFLPHPIYTNAKRSLGVLVSGVGKANAAASLAAFGFSPWVDLSQSYILFAGIAGGPPDGLPLGSVLMPSHIVDGDLRVEVDISLKPPGVAHPWWRLGTTGEGTTGALEVGYETYDIDQTLRERVFGWVGSTCLKTDEALGQMAKSYGLLGATPCEAVFEMGGAVVASDTYWVGAKGSQRSSALAHTWVRGPYRAAAMEDGGYVAALSRLVKAGRVDAKRAFWLRAISNFDQPFPGQSTQDCCRSVTLGFKNATDNLSEVGSRAIEALLCHG